jgi:glycerol-3-phosphate dehydrogenase
MRRALGDFDRTFDVAVIGGGINGTAVARELAIAGYSVALVERADFGSGATSRSSRFAHCGLNHLAPQTSTLDHLRHPLDFARGLRMARRMLRDRAALVTHHGRHVQRFRACLPVYEDGAFAPWQVRAAFGLLTLPQREHPLLRFRWLDATRARAHSFAPLLGGTRRLAGIAEFDEYQFVWPERMCIEAAIDAERHGAVVRNYTAARSLKPRSSGGWEIELADVDSGSERVRTTARFVINTAGPWADALLRGIAGNLPPCLTLTKGAHVLVRLPPACAGQGLVTLAADGHFFTAAPCGEFHYLGPTETPHDGDPEDVQVTEDDIAQVLARATEAMPSAKLSRGDVVAAWAGVRPVTHSGTRATGLHERAVHDFAERGVRDLLTLSWGRLVDHRDTARVLVDAVAARFAPESRGQEPGESDLGNEPAASLDSRLEAGRVKALALGEHVLHLDDILFRRSSLGWRPDLDDAAVFTAAAAAAEALGWSGDRLDDEIRLSASHRRDALGIRH